MSGNISIGERPALSGYALKNDRCGLAFWLISIVTTALRFVSWR